MLKKVNYILYVIFVIFSLPLIALGFIIGLLLFGPIVGYGLFQDWVRDIDTNAFGDQDNPLDRFFERKE